MVGSGGYPDNPGEMGNGIWAMRYGKTVTLYIRGGSDWGPTVTGSLTKFCTLPEGFRPALTCGGIFVTPGSTQYGVVNVSTSGDVSASKSYGGDTRYYQACVSYVVA